MMEPSSTQSLPAPAPETPAPARAQVAREERVAAGVLLGGYGLMWEAWFAMGVTPLEALGELLDTLRDLFNELRQMPTALPPGSWEVTLAGALFGLIVLTLPLAVQALARLCGWRGFLRGRWGWHLSFGHSAAYLSGLGVTYLLAFANDNFGSMDRTDLMLSIGGIFAFSGSFSGLRLTRAHE